MHNMNKGLSEMFSINAEIKKVENLTHKFELEHSSKISISGKFNARSNLRQFPNSVFL